MKISLVAEIDNLETKLNSLINALTPSAKTKAAYIGEFHYNTYYVDENGDEIKQKNTVPWDTTKEIMKAILNYAYENE